MKRKTRFKKTEIGMIPEDWEVDSLGNNVEKVFCGRDPSGGKQSHSKNITKYRIIQSAPVFDGYLEKSNVGYISQEMYSDLETASLKEEDVLLNQLGDGITFARSCVVPKEILPAIITRSVGCIRCNKNTLDPWFLNAFLIMPRTKEYIESFDSGSSRRAIDSGKMRSFLIPIPPLIEQKKIGYFFKIIQDKLELNQHMNQTLEAIGQALFKHWFIDYEFPNEKGLPYRSNGGEMIHSKLGDMPQGWETKEISEVTQVIDCLHIKKPINVKEGKVLLQVFNIESNGKLNLSDFYHVCDSDYEVWTQKIELRKGDCIISKTGRVGAVAQIPDGLHFGIGRNLVAIRSTKILSTFLLEYLISKYGKQEIQKLTMSGTILRSLHVKHIRKILILLPPSDILKNYEKIARPFRARIENNLKEIDELTNIRDSLIPKLVSGRIRVVENS